MKLRRVTSAWARFYRPLKAALPPAHYHPGLRLEALEQEPDKVVAVLADGTRLAGDLLIGADGLRSTVRHLLNPDLRPTYAGYVGWRILVGEEDVPAALRASLFDRYTFCLPQEGLVVAFPVPGRGDDTQAGQRAYNIVWYRPTNGARLADLSTDAVGRHHTAGIPPPLIRPELIAEMKAQAAEQLAPALAEIIGRAAQVFFQPIYELASPRLVFGRVALLGDAAFVARPHGGAGVTKAALDAASLADALAVSGGNIEAGLAHYDLTQRKLGDWFVGRSRQLGAYVTAADRRPDIVLRDYNATNAELRTLIGGAPRP
jgi:2-polyprenyl-6-methoxyphenol hydroxylase-like FAD-dependent oxidoreductase